jgi:hypothetical protein
VALLLLGSSNLAVLDQARGAASHGGYVGGIHALMSLCVTSEDYPKVRFCCGAVEGACIANRHNFGADDVSGAEAS